MKVKVKKIKRTPEIDLQLAKTKVKVKAREFEKSIKQLVPESGSISFYYRPNAHYVSCSVQDQDHNVCDKLGFSIGGYIWNA